MPRQPKPEPTPDQLAALQRFAKKYGRCWKQELGFMWMDGRDEREPDGALLRQIRNNMGPSWLYRFQLPKED